MMSDFHGDGSPDDPGDIRYKDLDNYFKACARHSDRDFLLMPGEEPNTHIGGHYTAVIPKPVYWTKVRNPVSHSSRTIRSSARSITPVPRRICWSILEHEQGLIWQAHPRTKGSTPYPDTIRETAHFNSDRYLGGAYQSLPVDLSEKRICEARCIGVLDDMNNWTGPKYLVSEGDTYMKFPEDEIYW